jgi:hypothetical protein
LDKNHPYFACAVRWYASMFGAPSDLNKFRSLDKNADNALVNAGYRNWTYDGTGMKYASSPQETKSYDDVFLEGRVNDWIYSETDKNGRKIVSENINLWATEYYEINASTDAKFHAKYRSLEIENDSFSIEKVFKDHLKTRVKAKA